MVRCCDGACIQYRCSHTNHQHPPFPPSLDITTTFPKRCFNRSHLPRPPATPLPASSLRPSGSDSSPGECKVSSECKIAWQVTHHTTSPPLLANDGTLKPSTFSTTERSSFGMHHVISARIERAARGQERKSETALYASRSSREVYYNLGGLDARQTVQRGRDGMCCWDRRSVSGERGMGSTVPPFFDVRRGRVEYDAAERCWDGRQRRCEQHSSSTCSSTVVEIGCQLGCRRTYATASRCRINGGLGTQPERICYMAVKYGTDLNPYRMSLYL
ncbi:hypothetical protein C7974DRAFT_90616 [Boeremia exigua]|uniref:uncharacterized protein n=1 Tax=Boeremia exigua TaxID=749465 RepID=UPI001E8E9DDA|nr:uncharacterized protein C7974DRAFT_90616 [Boeremia exigua]KAH6612066.1 hypothetical protein C7974DRAFT_90616 [Boeremia exigua]